jgi:hypothetical protein
MLISFVGCPCSGKTTTSSSLFNKLKLGGLPVENLSEEARVVIAKKRYLAKQEGKPFVLTDEDQWHIMKTQANREAALDLSLSDTPGGLVIADGSCLNSLLYMSEEYRQDPAVKDLTKKMVSMTALVFYCKPVDLPDYVKGIDPNRVHNQDQSRVIDEQILDLLRSIGVENYTLLQGSMDTRLSRAYQAVNIKMGDIFRQIEHAA